MTTLTVGNAQELRELFPAFKARDQYQAFYSSPEALAEHAKGLNRSSCWLDTPWDEGRAGFMGTDSMRAAIELVQNGWQEGARRVEKLRDKINAANPLGPRLVKWHVAGAYPSVGRALSGNPLNMRMYDSAKLRRRPVITLLSSMAVNCDTQGDTLTNRAAVCAAIVDAIEAAGYSCHVVSFQTVNDYSGNTLQLGAITLKEPGAPVDLARLAFGLGHAAMFRRLGWTMLVENQLTAPLGSSLGRAYVIEGTEAKRMAESNAFVLPPAMDGGSQFTSEARAEKEGLAMLVKALQDQGCPAFPKPDDADAA